MSAAWSHWAHRKTGVAGLLLMATVLPFAAGCGSPSAPSQQAAAPTAPQAPPQQAAAPTAPQAPPQPAVAATKPKIKLTAKAAVAPNGSIEVQGETDVPDGAIIRITPLDAQGNYLGQATVNTSGGKYRGSVALEQAVNGEIRVRVSLDPSGGQPDAVIQLIGAKGEKLKEIAPDGWTAAPFVYKEQPSAYLDLKVTITASAQFPADRRPKVLADAKKIAALDVHMAGLIQQAREVHASYFGLNNAKGSALMDPLYNDIEHTEASLEGSAQENLAPEVLPYVNALIDQAVADLNAAGKINDALVGGTPEDFNPDLNEALKSGEKKDALLEDLAKRLNVSVDALTGR